MVAPRDMRTTTSRILLLLLLLIVSTAWSPEAVSVSASEVDCKPNPAAMEDIATIAEQKGLTLDEAVARYGWQECFSQLVGQINEAYPDEYAGAAITDEGLGAWVAFKDEIPDGVDDLVAPVPVDVELIGGRGFSESELVEVSESVHSAVSSHPEVAEASSSYDIETGAITVHVEPVNAPAGSAERVELAERLRPEPPGNPAIAVEVVVVNDVGDDDADSGEAGGIGSMAWPGFVAGGVVALAAMLLIKRRRSSNPGTGSSAV
jgi:hypothetical protein